MDTAYGEPYRKYLDVFLAVMASALVVVVSATILLGGVDRPDIYVQAVTLLFAAGIVVTTVRRVRAS